MTAETLESLLLNARRVLRSGAYQEAIERYEQILGKEPACHEALVGIAEAYRYFNRTDRIVEIYERAVAAAPDNEDARGGYIEALMADAQTGKARSCAMAAVDEFPQVLRYRLQLAQTDVILGDTDAAKGSFWQCLAQDEDNTDCLFYLSQLCEGGELERLRPCMEATWTRRDTLEDWDKATLGYAYGRLFEKLRDYDKAWEGYDFGAKARRPLVRFDEPAYARTYDAHRQTFASNTPYPDDKTSGEEFVFICSLPRSGSTLVEQMLDAHHQVEAIGERSICYDAVTYWHKTYGPDANALFSAQAISDARDFYTSRARALVSRDDTVIVDKSITNFLFLGFLRTILPGAKFLHVVRDPLDTAISCLTTSFYAGNEWTYDLPEIGRNIRRYQKLMRHWLGLFPERILTVRYEELIGDPETLARQMISFCGLEWDPACLTFHESKREVLSASLLQVRQPIYQSAKGRAARYEKHLGPLLAAMGRRAANPHWFEKTK